MIQINIKEELLDLVNSARLEQKQRNKMNMIHVDVVKKLEDLKTEVSHETSSTEKSLAEQIQTSILENQTVLINLHKDMKIN